MRSAHRPLWGAIGVPGLVAFPLCRKRRSHDRCLRPHRGSSPLGLGIAGGFVVERIRQAAAYRTHGEILKQAEVEAANLPKTQELAAKEDLFKHRESMERELQKSREELRELERKLDRRDILLNEQQEDIGKKERMLELTQHKLTDRAKALEVREREVERVLEEEQEQLFKISPHSTKRRQPKCCWSDWIGSSRMKQAS